MTTPWAPSASAAARPRPSAIPPAATTGIVAGDVDDLGHERQRADEAAVPAGLAALRDDHVDAAADGLARPGRRPSPAGSSGCRRRARGHQVAGVAQVEGDGGRPRGEGGREGVLVERADLVVDRERAVRPVGAAGATGPRSSGTRADGGAEAAQAAGGADRRRRGRRSPRDRTARRSPGPRCRAGRRGGYACRERADRTARRHRANAPSSAASASEQSVGDGVQRAPARVETPIFR